jgi:surfeit locus 1 family protein
LARDGAYLRVRVAGRWLTGRAAFVQAVTDLGPGWWVIEGLSTREGVVLVNRGFVPQEARGRTPPATGEAVVTGLLRRDEPGGGYLRSNDAAADRWYSRDVFAIAGARGWGKPAPFFVDADAATSPDWPRGGLTVVRFPDNHLIYALTWFTLAGMALWFGWRVARGPRLPQEPSP